MINWQRPLADPGDTEIECFLHVEVREGVREIIKRTWDPSSKTWISYDVPGFEPPFGDPVVKAWMYVNDLPCPSWLDTRKLPGET